MVEGSGLKGVLHMVLTRAWDGFGFEERLYGLTES